MRVVFAGLKFLAAHVFGYEAFVIDRARHFRIEFCAQEIHFLVAQLGFDMFEAVLEVGDGQETAVRVVLLLEVAFEGSMTRESLLRIRNLELDVISECIYASYLSFDACKYNVVS